jgi:hypothetical protein
MEISQESKTTTTQRKGQKDPRETRWFIRDSRWAMMCGRKTAETNQQRKRTEQDSVDSIAVVYKEQKKDLGMTEPHNN